MIARLREFLTRSKANLERDYQQTQSVVSGTMHTLDDAQDRLRALRSRCEQLRQRRDEALAAAAEARSAADHHPDNELQLLRDALLDQDAALRLYAVELDLCRVQLKTDSIGSAAAKGALADCATTLARFHDVPGRKTRISSQLVTPLANPVQGRPGVSNGNGAGPSPKSGEMR